MTLNKTENNRLDFQKSITFHLASLLLNPLPVILILLTIICSVTLDQSSMEKWFSSFSVSLSEQMGKLSMDVYAGLPCTSALRECLKTSLTQQLVQQDLTTFSACRFTSALKTMLI